jgi:hypothetical protein
MYQQLTVADQIGTGIVDGMPISVDTLVVLVLIAMIVAV